MNNTYIKSIKYAGIAALAAFMVSGGSSFNSYEAFASKAPVIPDCVDLKNTDCEKGAEAKTCTSESNKTRCLVCVDPDGNGKYKWELLSDEGPCHKQRTIAFINAEKGIGLIDHVTEKPKTFKVPSTKAVAK